VALSFSWDWLHLRLGLLLPLLLHFRLVGSSVHLLRLQRRQQVKPAELGPPQVLVRSIHLKPRYS
jgi:hypothetical protein